MSYILCENPMALKIRKNERKNDFMVMVLNVQIGQINRKGSVVV